MSYKNNEGYPDPTAGKAVRSAGRMPTHIYNAFCVLNNTAGLLGLEITGLRDKKQVVNGHRGGENDVGNISWFRYGVRNRSPGAGLDWKQSDPVNQAAAEEIRD